MLSYARLLDEEACLDMDFDFAGAVAQSGLAEAPE